jgi:hypothetical protein
VGLMMLAIAVSLVVALVAADLQLVAARGKRLS